MHRFLVRSIPLLAYVPLAMRHRMGKPLPTSFFTRAFLANRRTANAIASTPYLQSMHEGTLDPFNYGCLTVQDAHYCYNARETLIALLDKIDRERDADLYDLVESEVRAYADYNRTFIDDWHIRDTSSIVPTETIRRYVEHERRVATDEDPIYTLAAYLPCHYLWPWFSRRLQMSPRYRPGVYRGWFESIYKDESESFGGSWLLGSCIEDWKNAGKPFDEGLAHDIYRASMNFELQVFSEACEGKRA